MYGGTCLLAITGILILEVIGLPKLELHQDLKDKLLQAISKIIDF
jgi:hypothetical protein